MEDDACSGARVIHTTPFRDAMSTATATTAVADPRPSCATTDTCYGGRGSSSVWYRFTAPVAGTASARTVGSDHDTIVAVYRGGCEAEADLACGVGVAPAGGAVATFETIGGESYLIEVAARECLHPDRLAFAFDFVPGAGTTTTTTLPAECHSAADCRPARECAPVDCVAGRCVTGTLEGFTDADCLFAQAVFPAICSSAKRLGKMFTRHVAHARRLVRRASAARHLARRDALLARADRVLDTVRRRAAKAAAHDRIRSECRTSIDGTLGTFDQILSSLRTPRAGAAARPSEGRLP
jgi:hypothetical protein